ncbi:MAG TPA: RNA polymerase sigma factor [Haliangiales bacterium]|nr:RNA polymerase sigma factor [Haliangiales bacterium]
MDLDRVFRDHRGHALATLIRLLGDWDVAEEALQDAFEAALLQWRDGGVPDNPTGWLVKTARFKGIDRIRRRARLSAKAKELEADPTYLPPDDRDEPEPDDDDAGADDRLKLLFTCCHPALQRDAQVALTLRTLCGLSTDEIARAFLVPAPTLAQRLVRAKGKIAAARIPYRVAPREEWPERLDAVLSVVYLVFNEGYAATAGDALVRRDLCREAIRLARLLTELLPDEGEPIGLLALLLLHDSRRDARTTAGGDIVLLEDQDRSRWDRAEIAEGLALTERALGHRPPGPYALQAAISALHAEAPRPGDTDWSQIHLLYDELRRRAPSPVVELNHAVAVAMAQGLERGLALLDGLAGVPELRAYHLLPAARADLLRRLGRYAEAADAYREALALVGNEPERRFLLSRLDAIIAACAPSPT